MKIDNHVYNFYAHTIQISSIFSYTVVPFVAGDDWEHEEIFTDDDEAVGINPEEREEFEPEVPAPPEIKQVRYTCSVT